MEERQSIIFKLKSLRKQINEEPIDTEDCWETGYIDGQIDILDKVINLLESE